ncbi:MAG: 50S ribosomal protein L13 [Thermoanaerobaculaceae bacterium]|nr:50S ribosomal protein L13 [Thermoanaerobaculaceae bacterium]MDI9622524.1 50S ribosomal protein L13 [Acidobacteriota bacterium]NLH12040.1 50S ribosomal protein L13 [Holophagae bacterium]HPW56150.1 50S ribosomal protein L13 [Thermoanaerobaculaceae bacterium]
MKTYIPKSGEVSRDWYVVDATDVVLGRLSTTVATLLRGKHKPAYTPSLDVGDFVIVVNAERVKLTGAKWDDKRYYRHSGHPGHLKVLTARQMRERTPERIIRYAVWGMLPKNRLGRALLRKLKVYAGAQHPHEAQQPQAVKVRG